MCCLNFPLNRASEREFFGACWAEGLGRTCWVQCKMGSLVEHTHIHIYIYIYIYMEFGDILQSSLRLCSSLE